MKRNLIATMLALIAGIVVMSPTALARSVVDENNVWYEIIGNTKTVNVSASNKNEFVSKNVDIVIPATVVDCSTNPETRGETYTVVGIENNAFEGTSIKSIDIRIEGLTAIPQQAFRSCAKLESVKIPTTVTTLLAQAFQSCSMLQSIEGIENVTVFKNDLFSYSGLTNITLPSGLIEMGVGDFSNCSNLESIEIPGGVKEIPLSCFSKCGNLKSVILHEGLTKIGQDAFLECKSLAAPAFPSTLTLINSQAFSLCENLGVLKFDYPATAEQTLTLNNGAFTGAGMTDIVWSAYPITMPSPVFRQVKTLTELTLPAWMDSTVEYGFSECEDLERVICSEGVTKIKQRTFVSCKKLKSVKLASSVKWIEMYAFNDCWLMESVEFPAEMESIGMYAFYNCKQITSVVLPAGADLGNNIFQNVPLTSITFPEQAMGTIADNPFGQQNLITTMSIPAWMTEIPGSLCCKWAALKNVTIPEGVVKIGNNAFEECTKIESLTLPSTVVEIGASAFRKISTTNVTFPEGLITIGEKAFQNCPLLTKVELPSTLESLGNYVFEGCTNMGSAKVECPKLKLLPGFAFSGCGNLTSVVLANGLEEVGANSFSGCHKLPHPGIPSTVKTVGYQAFADCQALGKVILNAGVHYCDNAYGGCGGQVGQGITEIEFPAEPCTFGIRVFTQNMNIKEITLPDWMVKVPNAFCQNWQYLEKVNLPQNLVEIDSLAFDQCFSLHNVEFPPSLKVIDVQAFKMCKSGINPRADLPKFGPINIYSDMYIFGNAFEDATVTEVNFVELAGSEGCAEFSNDVFLRCKEIEKISFPSCMTYIPNGFCAGWASLTTVSLAEGIKSIGERVFQGCSSLSSVPLPESVDWIGADAFNGSALASFEFPEHRTHIGPGALAATKIKTITIPSYLEGVPDKLCRDCFELEEINWEEIEWNHSYKYKIGDEAFYQCKALTTITMPEVDLELGKNVFNSCSGATSIQYCKSPIKLGESCFAKCTELRDITIPDNIEVISNGCFQNNKLGTVNLGKSVTAIGSSAFYNAELTEIIWSPNIQIVSNAAFKQNKLTEVRIPGSLKYGILEYDPYHPIMLDANAFEGNTLLTKVVIEEGVETLSSSLFKNCNLQTIEFPSTLRRINDNAFEGNKNLVNVNLNEGLSQLGQNVFKDCTALTEFVFPVGMKRVGTNVFQNCKALKKIISHGEGITFDSQAFYNLEGLEEFICDGSINTIGSTAFTNCKLLNKFEYSGAEPIAKVQGSAFQNCEALTAFPYLDKAKLEGGYHFAGCINLKQMSLPSVFSLGREGYPTTVTDPQGIFSGDLELQSITWANPSGHFAFDGIDIHNCPLKALSYSYADNIARMSNIFSYSGSRDQTSIVEYRASDISYKTPPTVTNPQQSKLMVKRGQKWKYHEAGYDKVFDIIEMKDPKFNIEGDLYCDYDQVNNKNKYTVYLRWEVPLSDLDQTKDTYVTVYRDKTPIGNLTFKKPLDKVYNSEYQCEVIEVPVEFGGESTTTAGDFLFPIKKSDGTTIWQRTKMSQGSSMFFDAYSHKRLDSFDTETFNSWYMMIDEFETDDLGDGGIPRQYKYTAKMTPYTYFEYENYPDLIPKDGNYYDLQEKTYAGEESDECTVYVAMAMPSMEFQGLYTTDEVMQDLAHGIQDSSTVDYQGYRVTYDIEKSIADMKWRDLGSSTEMLIYDKVEAYEYDDASDSWNLVATINLDGKTNMHGEIDLGTAGNPAPGKKYRTIVTTTQGYRGTYGSPIMTVPDAPKVKAILNVQYPQHLWDVAPYFRETHHHVVYEANLTLYPEQDDSFSTTGYDSFKDMKMMGHSLDDGDYFIGVWRKTADTTPVYGAPRRIQALSNEPDELIYHADGRPEEATDSHCDDCSTGVGEVTTSETGVSVKDTYDIPWDHDHDVEYRARVYMKVPDSMLRGDTRWMMAEVTPSMELGMPTIVEGVLTDGSERMQERWFDMQGFEVKTPESGKPYIRVCGGRSERVVR